MVRRVIRVLMVGALLIACASDRNELRDDTGPGPSELVANNSGVTAAEPPASLVQSPDSVIAAFYSDYVPIALSRGNAPSWYSVFGREPAVLANSLLSVMREDSAAWAQAPGEIAGIDFDPFLASQDPCDRYEVGAVTGAGLRRLVHVFGVCSGTRSTDPDVTIELVLSSGVWLIDNIRYPRTGSDLRSILTALH
jgi:hypothetical protein